MFKAKVVIDDGQVAQLNKESQKFQFSVSNALTSDGITYELTMMFPSEGHYGLWLSRTQTDATVVGDVP